MSIEVIFSSSGGRFHGTSIAHSDGMARERRDEPSDLVSLAHLEFILIIVTLFAKVFQVTVRTLGCGYSLPPIYPSNVIEAKHPR